MRRMTALLVGLALVGAVAAGCSSSGGGKGSNSNDSGNTSSISKAEFLKKGNKLCKSVMDKVDKEAQSQGLDSASTSKQADFIKNRIVPEYSKLISNLRALGYPKGDEQTLKKIYAKADARVAQYKKDPKAALNNNGTSDIDKQFDAYGLTACGSGDSGSSDSGTSSSYNS